MLSGQNVPTIKPETMVLGEAPSPEAVPTKPWARVEPAGAAGEVGDDQRLQDSKHGPADAVQKLGGNDEYRLGNDGPDASWPRESEESD